MTVRKMGEGEVREGRAKISARNNGSDVGRSKVTNAKWSTYKTHKQGYSFSIQLQQHVFEVFVSFLRLL